MRLKKEILPSSIRVASELGINRVESGHQLGMESDAAIVFLLHCHTSSVTVWNTSEMDVKHRQQKNACV